MTDPALNLGYAFADPATVYVTVDDARPVSNTLTLVITNRAGAAVEFQNPQGLTPQSELPAWSDQASPLGRIAVWFPWGDASGDLARAADATRIVASSRVQGWGASPRMSDPQIGVYWTLFPLSKAVFLDRDASISFEFTGIVSHVGTGGRVPEQTWMTALPRVPGYTSTQSQTGVWKQELTASLSAPAAAIPGDQIELSWTSSGAEYCSLSPGGFDNLPKTGQQSVRMPARPSVTYTVTAHPASGRPVSDAKTVTAQTGWIDLGPCPAFSWTDGVFAFRVGAEYICLHTGPHGVWASADGRSWAERASLPPLVDVFGASDGRQLWIMGLDRPGGQPGQTAVIARTTDARSWDIRKGAPWEHVHTAAGAAFQGALWVLGGWHVLADGKIAPSTAVWYSNDGGASWNDAPPVPWPANETLDVGQVAPFAGRLWAMVEGRDVWATANGREWTRQQTVPWGESTDVGLLTASEDSLYGIGVDGRALQNVLWRMDHDQTWSQIPVTPALSFGVGPGLAPYASGVVAVGTRAFRLVPPVAGGGG